MNAGYSLRPERWNWVRVADGTSGNFPSALCQLVVFAAAGGGLWLLAWACVGVAWSGWLVGVFLLLTVPLAVRAGGHLVTHPPSLAAAVTAIAVVLLAAARASVPAWGWDFRYIWGLKAKVLALHQGFDWGWLAWPAHQFAHPSYPPLWSTLLAGGVLLGGGVERAAAMWAGLLTVGLAAGCWALVGSRPPWARMLAALLGALSPGLWSADRSGYAEPLLAFLLVAAALSLQQKASGATVGLAMAGLSLAKQEGLVWAVLLALFGWASLPARVRLAAGGGVLVGVGWLLITAAHGVGGPSFVLHPAHWGQRALLLPQAMLTGLDWRSWAVLAAVVISAWCCPPGAWVRRATAAFAVILLLQYLCGSHDLGWWLSTSLGRVLSVPLPALIAVALDSKPSQDN